ncbi:hypothetical protein MXD63_42990, partial [Frankia sp. Cpl3]|nr:hypothetical protein [Frankia sp. Cpl3]
STIMQLLPLSFAKQMIDMLMGNGGAETVPEPAASTPSQAMHEPVEATAMPQQPQPASKTQPIPQPQAGMLNQGGYAVDPYAQQGMPIGYPPNPYQQYPPQYQQ